MKTAPATNDVFQRFLVSRKKDNTSTPRTVLRAKFVIKPDIYIYIYTLLSELVLYSSQNCLTVNYSKVWHKEAYCKLTMLKQTLSATARD